MPRIPIPRDGKKLCSASWGASSDFKTLCVRRDACKAGPSRGGMWGPARKKYSFVMLGDRVNISHWAPLANRLMLVVCSFVAGWVYSGCPSKNQNHMSGPFGMSGLAFCSLFHRNAKPVGKNIHARDDSVNLGHVCLHPPEPTMALWIKGQHREHK